MFKWSLTIYKISHVKKQIDIHVQIPQSVSLEVNSNSMSIAVRNIINNALKFTPVGGELIVRGEENDNQVILEFADNGVGMSEEKVNKLFSFKVSNSTYGTENEKGVGLGLQLVYSCIQSHNAQIEIESKLGEGTTFRMVFDKVKKLQTI